MHKGQALIEVILALAITSLTLLAIVRLSTRSVTNANVSKDSTLATTFAKTGMEWIKQQKLYDATYSQWSTFLALANGSSRTYCLGNPPGWAVSSPCPVTSGLRREAVVTRVSANQVTVTVNVYRADTTEKFVELTSIFTNYE